MQALKEDIKKYQSFENELAHERMVQIALFQIAEVTDTTDNINLFYRSMHQIIGKLMYAENLYIAIIEEDGKNISYPYFYDTRDEEEIKKFDIEEFDKTLPGYVCKMGEAILITREETDNMREAGHVEVVTEHMVDWIGVPLKRNKQVFGILVVQSYDPEIRYKLSDKDLLKFVSHHIITALNRKRADQVLKQTRSELEKLVYGRTKELSIANQRLIQQIDERAQAEKLQQALFQISELSNQNLKLEEFFESIHHIIDKLMYAKNCYITVFSDDNNSVLLPYMVDLKDKELVDQLPRHLSIEKFYNTLTGYVVKTKTPLLSTGQELKRMSGAGLFSMVGSIFDDWINWLGVPFMRGDTVLGAIVVQSYEKSIKYTEADKELLTFVAQHIATALTRNRAERSLKKAHSELEKRVEKRTEELSVANKQLKKEIIERKRTEQLQAALYRIAELANQSIELYKFYESLHNIISGLIYAGNFYIALINEGNNTIEFSYVVDEYNDTADYKPRSIVKDEVAAHRGYTEYVISKRKPLLINADNVNRKELEAYGHQSYAWLGVPLMRNDDPVGVLAVQSYSEEISYENKDKELLTYVSQHVANALQRKRDADLLKSAHKELKIINDELEQRVNDRTRELSATNEALEKTLIEQKKAQKLQAALYQIAEVASSAEDLESFYASIHRIISTLTYANNLFIAVCDDTSGVVNFPYFKDEYPDEYQLESLSKDQFLGSLTGYVYKTRESLLISSSEQLKEMQKKFSFKVYGRDDMVDWLGVPLKIGNEVFGAIVVQSYDESYRHDESDKELLTFVSQHIATAFLRKQSEQALRRAHEDLEKRVELRTKELSEANTDLEKQILERERAEKLQAALYQIAELTNKSIVLEEFYASLHEIINKLIYAKNIYIAIVDEDSGNLVYPYVADQYANSSDEDSRVISLNPCSRKQREYTELVLKDQKPLLVTRDCSSTMIISSDMRDVFAWLGVPLVRNNEPIGVLAIQSYTDEIIFEDKDMELLTFVSQHISAALQRKRDSDLLNTAHEQLQIINDELEKRVKNRTHELSKANIQLQEMLEERKRIEKKLAHDACHDALTDLPNRTLFIDRLDNAIKRNSRNQSASFAVLFLDLDRFKVVNDSLGHLEGDMLLRDVSARLEKCIRPGDTVARLGGDEFCILIDGADSENKAIDIAERILTRLAEPFKLGEETIFISTSIGITLSSIGYTDPDTVLRDADAAMYRAKSQGKAQYAIFDKTIYEQAINRLKLENELRFAVEKSKIEVYYQPIINIQTGQIIAFEALARWFHDELGFISPIEFISIAEETGLIFKLGLYILDQSAKQARRWRDLGHAYSDIGISVNLSPKQIAQPELFDNIMSVFKTYDISSDAIKFEITESLLIHNFEQSKELLDRLSREGIQILLDDFGTGYSSLSYLHHFPLSTLKIDRSFVMKLNEREENKEIIRTIKTLADSLNMSVIAEGIETIEQLKMLSEFGFEFGQGYYFSRPMSAQDAEAFVMQYESQPQSAASR